MPDRHQPKILFITTDQQRFDTAPPAERFALRTPHLDDLAAKGMTFTRAYSDCPLCVPARSTIMSGQHAWTHRLSINGATSSALDDARTLPTRMRGLGYQTMAIGKMHFGPTRARHGFDDALIADDYHKQMLASGHALQPMRHGIGQNEFYPGVSTVPEAMTYTSWIAEQCGDFIRDRHDPTRPFFLWCSFGKPHPPFDPPEPYETQNLAASGGAEETRTRLHGELAARIAARPQEAHLVEEAGRLTSWDDGPVDARRQKARHWVGYHTEWEKKDVKH